MSADNSRTLALADLEKMREQLHRASCIIGLIANVSDEEAEIKPVFLAETARAAEELVLEAVERIMEAIRVPRAD